MKCDAPAGAAYRQAGGRQVTSNGPEPDDFGHSRPFNDQRPKDPMETCDNVRGPLVLRPKASFALLPNADFGRRVEPRGVGPATGVVCARCKIWDLRFKI